MQNFLYEHVFNKKKKKNVMTNENAFKINNLIRLHDAVKPVRNKIAF